MRESYHDIGWRIQHLSASGRCCGRVAGPCGGLHVGLISPNELQTKESHGLHSVRHPHEIDQLNGMFWITRPARLKKGCRKGERKVKLRKSNSPLEIGEISRRDMHEDGANLQSGERLVQLLI
jgi:hypothetical protein